MLDFLLSTDPSMASWLEASLRSVAVDPDRLLRCYSGPWGCLGVAGQAYPGFDVVENDRYIIVVLGGPLPRYDNSVADGSKPDDGTRWILHEWKVLGRLRWDEDLVGHFAVLCVDKTQNRVEAVTDINSFVPLYSTSPVGRTEVILLGSHVDALALASRRVDDIDQVSVADFLCYTTVTYPYTLYSEIFQIAPASIHHACTPAVQSQPYWEPIEAPPPGCFTECASLLRETIINNIQRICLHQPSIGLLMSAGEDSRVVATVARQKTQVKAFTFLDSYNREGRIAERIATQLGLDWRLIQRQPTHYLDHMQGSVRLSEWHRLFVHNHSVGFMDDWPFGLRVLGGHLADTFTKGNYVPRLSLARVTLGIRHPSPRDIWTQRASPPDDVLQRRLAHTANLARMRPSSAVEWCRLWPSSQLISIGHFVANRRQCCIYEPFIDSAIVKLSALTPQEWKVNRKLFRAAMRPLLEPTRNVPHPSGMYPYRGLLVNAFPQIITRSWAKVRPKVYRLAGRRPINDGPWPDWDRLTTSPSFERMVQLVLHSSRGDISDAIWSELGRHVLNGSTLERLVSLQVLAWSAWRMSHT